MPFQGTFPRDKSAQAWSATPCLLKGASRVSDVRLSQQFDRPKEELGQLGPVERPMITSRKGAHDLAPPFANSLTHHVLDPLTIIDKRPILLISGHGHLRLVAAEGCIYFFGDSLVTCLVSFQRAYRRRMSHYQNVRRAL